MVSSGICNIFKEAAYAAISPVFLFTELLLELFVTLTLAGRLGSPMTSIVWVGAPGPVSANIPSTGQRVRTLEGLLKTDGEFAGRRWGHRARHCD